MFKLFYIAFYNLTSRYCIAAGFAVLFTLSGMAQNLIPNNSFEQFNDPDYPYLDTSETVFIGVKEWFNPIDQIASVTSYRLENNRGNLNVIKPAHGQANGFLYFRHDTVGLFNHPYYKTFLQTKLLDTLQAGCKYEFSLYTLPTGITFIEPNPFDSLTNSGMFCGVKEIDAHFSNTRIFDSTSTIGKEFDNANIQPQIKLSNGSYITDTATHTFLKGSFIATGGEQYLTLGFFSPIDSIPVYNLRYKKVVTSKTPVFWGNVIRMHVDYLSLERLSPPDTLITSSRDTNLCPNDSLQIFSYAQDALSLKWDDGSTDSLRTITQPGTYWVEAYYPCGDVLSDTILVSPSSALPPINVADTTVCKGKAVQYTLPLGPDYLLDGNHVSNNFSLSQSGMHTLKASNVCETKTFNFFIHEKQVNPLPNISIGDTALCDGEQFSIALPPGFDYSLNGAALNSNSLLLDQRNEYLLEIDNSCETKTVSFSINDDGCEMELYIPSAFTPNGDGLNDCFEVYVTEYDSYHLQVFNRWGSLIFETYNPNDCWDGKVKGEIVMGTFVYKINADDGKSMRKVHGTVSVLL